MEALLTNEWLAPLQGARETPVLDEASLTLVREAVREIGAASGVPAEVVEKMVLVATELGRNQLRHAVGGRIAVLPVTDGGVPGLEVVAADRGLGIRDVNEAFEAAPRSSGSLGVGLASVSRLASEVDLDVRASEGTCVRARGFPPRTGAGRRCVGIFGRPIGGETRSGDHACFRREGDVLVVAVIDGLGHGDLARHAASAAVDAFHRHASASPVAILEACHAALAKTRGAVMAVARIDDAAGHVDVASVGNVLVQIVGPRTARRFGGSSFVLGTAAARVRRVAEERAAIARGEALVLATDGVPSRLAIENDLALLREPPAVLAQRVAVEHGRQDDDVLVLVAR